jgi:phospholipase/lecithinase/hemolysin
MMKLVISRTGFLYFLWFFVQASSYAQSGQSLSNQSLSNQSLSNQSLSNQSLSNQSLGSQYSGLVSFGDSLSDTGNLASVTTNFPFPFFDNRISNGPVLVDYLAAELGFQAVASRHTQTDLGGNNFSVSGGNIVGSDVEDLGSQVSAYLTRQGERADASNLFFLMIGGNDLRDIRGTLSASDATAKITLVAQTLEGELTRLYDAGARDFLISNVADVGSIPETLARQSTDPNISQRARDYVQAYNNQLDGVLQRLQSRPGALASKYDLFAELDRILNNASSLGFSQTEVGCFTLEQFSFHPDCVFGTRFDRFVFFDSLHPSAATNRIASSGLLASIPERDVQMSSVFMAAITLLLLD